MFPQHTFVILPWGILMSPLSIYPNPCSFCRTDPGSTHVLYPDLPINHSCHTGALAPDLFFFFIFNCMFYQLLCVQHSCSSTQSWGSVLPSIVETRDQNSRGCPLLFSNRNLGSFCAWGTEILYTHSHWEVVDHSRSKMHYTCLIIIHDPDMRPDLESNRGPLD